MANTRPGCAPAGFAVVNLDAVVRVRFTDTSRPSAPYGAPDLPHRAPMTMAQIVRTYDQPQGPYRPTKRDRVNAAKERKSAAPVSENTQRESDRIMLAKMREAQAAPIVYRKVDSY